MGLLKKTAEAADTAAAAIVVTGQKVGGKTGERAANRVSSALLGRHYCPPNETCQICR